MSTVGLGRIYGKFQTDQFIFGLQVAHPLSIAYLNNPMVQVHLKFIRIERAILDFQNEKIIEN